VKENQSQMPAGQTVGACVRCGTCCEKGGPALHHEDRLLIENGGIPARFLFTIRRGELVRDNVKGRLMPAASDIIKIKGRADGWTCIFLDDGQTCCTIYDDRPLECRVLKCWDTRELEKIYAGSRLTRQDLISGVEGLWELIRDHQQRCDYEEIRNLVNDLRAGSRQDAQRKLGEIVRYDTEIRELVLSRGGVEPDLLDFLFGRPLIKTLPDYGIRVRRQGRKVILEPKSNR
jgi:Fe-S-cluster containining protein